jgi:hypothetical protein
VPFHIVDLFSAELSDTPIGTGSLYVPHKTKGTTALVREMKQLNVTERQEAEVVQYLSLGAHTYFTGVVEEPDSAISAVHAGPGQQVFGWSDKQRCDLLLVFFAPPSGGPAKLSYHNYHGDFWHKCGHLPLCPKAAGDLTPLIVDAATLEMDEFRHGYARALSLVRPESVLFDYSTSFSCHYYHTKLVPEPPPRSYFSVKEWLSAPEQRAPRLEGRIVLPFGREEEILGVESLKQRIKDGTISGFATVEGGREGSPRGVAGGKHFGFCVQSWAPAASDLSPTTRGQIAEYFDFGEDGDEQVDKYVERLEPRTLNSTTFHSAETVSTSYLRWLMLERDFTDFSITHFIRYQFGEHSRGYLEPLLEKRHQYKRAGNTVAAECLKLLGNGSFG